jgi:hypothetical protein
MIDPVTKLQFTSAPRVTEVLKSLQKIKFLTHGFYAFSRRFNTFGNDLANKKKMYV